MKCFFKLLLLCFFLLSFAQYSRSQGFSVSSKVVRLITLSSEAQLFLEETDKEEGYTTVASSVSVDGNKTGGGSPGMLKISGGSLELVVDVSGTMSSSVKGRGAIDVFDFDLFENGSKNFVGFLPLKHEPFFWVPVGAKAKVFLTGGKIHHDGYFLNANYL